MITTLKLVAAGMLGWAIISPGNFVPRADDCECSGKADAASKLVQPRADDCECKADAKTAVPRAEDCECKGKAS